MAIKRRSSTSSATTGEHLVVLTLENASALEARVTAAGFAWGSAGPFKLVELHQDYNQLTQSVDARP